MAINLKVAYYRRLRSADIDINGTALVCGFNNHGKTSLAQAVRAVLTGLPLVAPGDAEAKRLKKDAKALVTDGEKQGMATITADAGAARVIWPECEYNTKGTPPKASTYAAGVDGQTIFDLPPKERMDALREAIGANPTEAETATFLAERGIPEPVIKHAWGVVHAEGWDGALSRAQKKGAELKGAFKEATGGETWGPEKGKGWKPAGWNPAWDTTEPTEFERAVASARADLEEFLRQSGAASAEAERKKHLVAGIPTLKAQIEQGEAALAAVSDEIAAVEAEGATLKGQTVVLEADCPHCEKPIQVVVAAGQWSWPQHHQTVPLSLQKPEKKGTKKNAKADQDRAAALDGKSDRLRRDSDGIKRALAAAKTDLERAEAIEAAGVQEGPTEGDKEKEAELRGRHDAAVAASEKAASRERAAAIHEKLCINQALVAALGPTGVRATVFGRCLGEVNQDIAALAGHVDFKSVVLHEDGRITADDLPWRDLSGSSRLRLSVLMQVAIARREGAPMIVVDIEDAIDRKHISRLLTMVSASKMPALICCHVPSMERIPVLSSKRAVDLGIIGRTYWVADGVVAPYAPAEE